MAQIAIIPASSSLAPPASSPVNSEQSQFSPHLENALSTNKQPLPAKNNNNTSDRFDQNAVEIVIGSPTMSTMDLAVTGEFLQVSVVKTETPDLAKIFSQPVSGSSILTGNPGHGQEILDFLPLNSSPDSKPTHILKTATVDFPEVLPATSSSLPVLTVSRQSTETGNNFENQALLVQLQKIINSSNETGTVSISRTESSPAIIASASEVPAANHNGLLLAIGGELKTTTGRPEQQLNTLRLDSQQQYYEAKVNLHGGCESNANSQDTSPGGDDTPQQPSATLPQNRLAVEAEPAPSFSQTSAVVQEAPAQTSTETAKTILLPSGTIIHEEEIVQQLIQRFQISGKLTDTRVNIRLNPAELGELKIDISVKDGSIKAHVVAQSQQAIEVIEKNISKLRTVLEDQGYSIDEISVTSESDSVGDFNLFEKQLFSQNDYGPPSGKETGEPGEIFNPEHFVEDKTDNISGVNVRV